MMHKGWLTHGRYLLLAMACLMTALASTQSSRAAEVVEVVSDLGIKAYLVNEPSIPMLSMSLYFAGGSATDPAGKEGRAYMVSGLLDEGAGAYDSQAFRRELEDNAIKLSFNADRDGFTGTLTTLNASREHAFELMRLALTEPRFDGEPVARIRSQIMTSLKRRETDPDYISSRSWFEMAFPDHPYGHPTRGTEDTITGLTVADFEAFVEERLGRDNLIIGVAGDIDAATLGPLLDKAFGGLPETSKTFDIPEAEPRTGQTEVVDLDVPQSVVTFGMPGMKREDPDYYIAHVANHILGGGGFGSRLMEEVREKRGLAYSVYSYLYTTEHAPMLMGGVSTRNEQVAQSIAIIREEIAKLARGEVGQEELDDAKLYLTGSFPLRLTSNASIARMLMGMQIADLGPNYINERNGFIEAVTLEDIRRVAARMFAGELLVTVVGRPVGLDG